MFLNTLKSLDELDVWFTTSAPELYELGPNKSLKMICK